MIIRFRSLNYDWIVADPVSISGCNGTDRTARPLRCPVWGQVRPLLSPREISMILHKLQTNLCFSIYVHLRELKIVVVGLLGRNSDVRPNCATLVDFRPTWSQVYMVTGSTTTSTRDLHDPTQASVSLPSFPSLSSPVSQKSICIPDPNASRSGSSSQSTPGYRPGSPRQLSPREQHVGGCLQTVPCGIRKTGRVASGVQSFA